MQQKKVLSPRKPLCGGDNITEILKQKIMEVMRKNQERSQSPTTRNFDSPKCTLPSIRPQIFNTIDAGEEKPMPRKRISLMEQQTSAKSRLNPTIKEILIKSRYESTIHGVTFENSTINNTNELINEESIQYYIQSNFKTRGSTPMKNSRWKTAFYIDEVCSDKQKILRKLRKIKYADFFAESFQVTKID